MWWLLPILALAEEAEPDEADLTIIVEDAKSIAKARAELDQAIRDEGYLPGVTVGERTFYVPLKLWKPKITFHEQGSVRVKARAVQPMFIGPGVISGTWGSPRMARELESRVLQKIDPALDAYKLAKSAYGQALRREALFTELEALRQRPPMEAWPDLAALWLNTADNAEGEAIRVQIEQFAAKHGILPHPMDVDALNAQRGFSRAWEPDYLGHIAQPVAIEPVVEPFERPSHPRCPEKPPPQREPTGLAADILNATPAIWDPVPDDWIDLAIPDDAKLDPSLRPLPEYSCPW